MQLKDYIQTEINIIAPIFQLDSTNKFGYKNTLDYKIIVNWAIAEHKYRGLMEATMNEGDSENFWCFKINGDVEIEKTRKRFEELKKTSYPAKSY